MILYFSGTGNSRYIAENLLADGEQAISIAQLMKKKQYYIELKTDEPLGLVFPVYFYTLPSVVREFLEKAEIKNSSYIYGVITCGGGTGQASAVLKKCLSQKGLTLSYFRDVLMPDNAMLFYQIPGIEQAEGRLSDAFALTKEIKNDVAQRKITQIKSATLIADLTEMAYKACMNTKKYYSTDNCIGCGLCEQNCPEQVIKLKNGKPVWQKTHCCKCTACINRCPVQAIQYGKGTLNRNRYVNPRVYGTDSDD